MLARLLDGDARRVDPAHLACADPECLTAAGEHDRVRGDVLRDRPGEQEVVPHRRVGVTADDVHRVERVAVGIAVLDEQAAEHAA